MSELKNRTLYLNTSDILTSNDNHCDATFNVSRFGLQCVNSERLSMSLKMAQIPTRTTYLQNSGTRVVMDMTSSEPLGANGRAGVSDTAHIYLSISNNIYQPPFVVDGNIFMAVPFLISQSVEDFINYLNTALDFRYADGTDATLLFEIDSNSGVLVVNGTDNQVISLQNGYMMPNDPFNTTTFTPEGERIALMLGINTNYFLADGAGQSATRFQNGTNTYVGNRALHLRFPTFVSSDGLLITTNLNFDSYSSLQGGTSNTLSQIPTQLAPINREYAILTQGSEQFFQEFRDGAILHRNQNVLDSHKTIGANSVDTLRLQVKGNDNQLRFCNTNITYIIEVRWFI